MGNNPSIQEINNFIRNNINTNIVAEVISRYATMTNAVQTNVQNLDVRIHVVGNVNGGITLDQEIQSYIDVEQLTHTADKTQLSADLQQAVQTSLDDTLERTSTGLAAFFSRPENQQLKNTVLNDINTTVRQTINTETVDELLTSSSNLQNGVLNIDVTGDVNGPIMFNQRIQAQTMARNIVGRIIERSGVVKKIAAATTTSKGAIAATNKGSLSDILGGNLTLIIAVVVVVIVIIGIIAAIIYFKGFNTTTIIIAGVLGLVALIAIGIGIWFFIRQRNAQGTGNANKTK